MTQKVIPLQDLAKYLVVIVTFSRCQNEFNGSKSRKSIKQPRPWKTKGDDMQDEVLSSPIVQLQWLRLVVDEGHELSKPADDDLTQFINQIAAERW
jgi:hypothetical protein